MSGINQNTKHLTIKQLRSIIANNGVLQGSAYHKALKANKPVEYCLESLNEALFAKLDKDANLYTKSELARRDEFNAMAGAYTNAFPPKMPVDYTTPIKPIINHVDKTAQNRESEIQQARVDYGAMLRAREAKASKILFRNSLILTAAGFVAAFYMMGA